MVQNTGEVQSNLGDNYPGSVSSPIIFASSSLTGATVRRMVDAGIIRGIIHQMRDATEITGLTTDDCTQGLI